MTVVAIIGALVATAALVAQSLTSTSKSVKVVLLGAGIAGVAAMSAAVLRSDDRDGVRIRAACQNQAESLRSTASVLRERNLAPTDKIALSKWQPLDGGALALWELCVAPSCSYRYEFTAKPEHMESLATALDTGTCPN